MYSFLWLTQLTPPPPYLLCLSCGLPSSPQALLAQQEVFEKNMPQITAPRRITATNRDSVTLPLPSPQAMAQCRMHSCFDYSRCSLLSNFPVYNYDMEQFKIASNDLEAFVKITVKQALGYNAQVCSGASLNGGGCSYSVTEDMKSLLLMMPNQRYSPQVCSGTLTG